MTTAHGWFASFFPGGACAGWCVWSNSGTEVSGWRRNPAGLHIRLRSRVPQALVRKPRPEGMTVFDIGANPYR